MLEYDLYEARAAPTTCLLLPATRELELALASLELRWTKLLESDMVDDGEDMRWWDIYG